MVPFYAFWAEEYLQGRSKQQYHNMGIRPSKVSVIISSYNRYDHLIKAVESVRRQTHPDTEIIVVDDHSADLRYQAAPLEGTIWIRLEKSSREVAGFPAPGYTRNQGIVRATGTYLAFLDDDDEWMPEKLARQLAAMANHEIKMSSTEALMGDGLRDPGKEYPQYNAVYYRAFYNRLFQQNPQFGIADGKLPRRITLQLMKVHNCLITSSVVIQRDIIDKTGLFRELKIGQEDYEQWLRSMEYTDCLYLDEPLVYYDGRLAEYRKKRLRRFGGRLLRRIGLRR